MWRRDRYHEGVLRFDETAEVLARDLVFRRDITSIIATTYFQPPCQSPNGCAN